jgi:uncharacterized protein YceH (UPF0502 family)
VDENDFKRLLDGSVGEMRRHFDIAIERVDNNVQLVVEGVTQVSEIVTRKTAELDERMNRGFSDTQAMIKFSHAELDRRVRALEEGLADVHARLDRLEGSTH